VEKTSRVLPADSGCDPSFIWWDQFEKTDNDCDELTAEEIEGSRRITPEALDPALLSGRMRRAWKKSKTFTPLQTVDQEWVRIDFEPGTITCVKSPLGSGKTQNLVRFIDENRSWLENKSLIIPGYRNSLLHQTIERIDATRMLRKTVNVPSEKHEKISDSHLASIPWVAGCLDSMYRIPIEALDGSAIIVDEIVSVLKHLLFLTRRSAQKREQIVDWFVEAIKRLHLALFASTGI
jgi:hypothetical protein